MALPAPAAHAMKVKTSESREVHFSPTAIARHTVSVSANHAKVNSFLLVILLTYIDPVLYYRTEVYLIVVT